MVEQNELMRDLLFTSTSMAAKKIHIFWSLDLHAATHCCLFSMELKNIKVTEFRSLIPHLAVFQTLAERNRRTLRLIANSFETKSLEAIMKGWQ